MKQFYFYSIASFLINFQFTTGETKIPEFDKRFKPFVTILSGGIKISLNGKDLNLSTQTHLRANGRKANVVEWFSQELCEVVSDVEVKCRTPRLLIPEVIMKEITDKTVDHSLPLNLSNFNQFIDFSFITDSFIHPLDLPEIYSDPFIEIFPDELVFIANKGDNKIFIEGVWPRSFHQLEDSTHIQVGGRECQDVRMVNRSHVSCIPHALDTHVIRFGGDDVTKLPVRVRVGNAEYVLGELRYEHEESMFHPIPIVMVTIISIIIITSVFFSIHAKCTSKKNYDRLRGDSRNVKDQSESTVDKNIFKSNDSNNNNKNKINDDGDDYDINNEKTSGNPKAIDKKEANELDPFIPPEDKRQK